MQILHTVPDGIMIIPHNPHEEKFYNPHLEEVFNLLFGVLGFWGFGVPQNPKTPLEYYMKQ